MNGASQESKTDPNPIAECAPTSTRRPYEPPRLSDCGSLAELTKGGGLTGPDQPGIPFGNRPG